MASQRRHQDMNLAGLKLGEAAEDFRREGEQMDHSVGLGTQHDDVRQCLLSGHGPAPAWQARCTRLTWPLPECGATFAAASLHRRAGAACFRPASTPRRRNLEKAGKGRKKTSKGWIRRNLWRFFGGSAVAALFPLCRRNGLKVGALW